MGAPYTSQSTSGYNSNPPPDDGTETEANRVKWSTIKTKLADVLKTFGEAINSAVSTAFGKIPGGAGITSTAISYQVLSSDQGKTVRATAASITITTPDATNVGTPFLFFVLNNSSGTITVDGSGSQTIDGAASISLAAGAGCMLNTDGTNWYSAGLAGTLAGSQMSYGSIVNGTITESNATNAATFAIKTLAGTDPSSNDQVLIAFRNATVGTGNYVYRAITAALSLTLTAGSTLAASNGVAFRAWLVLFDDGGTLRLGIINCLSGTNIYPLGRMPIASSTAEGGAGGADSAHVFYTGTAVASKAYVILGYVSYESGLSTAGNWNVSPTRIQLFGPGVPLPGNEIQIQENFTGAVATGTTTMPGDDTIPTITEGDQYMTQSITPTSTANLLEIESLANLSNNSDTVMAMALFQDATSAALAVVAAQPRANSALGFGRLLHKMLAGTVSATTMRIRAGTNGAGTTTFNGTGGARLYGGALNSFLRVREIQT